jgi:hypothetical protein
MAACGLPDRRGRLNRAFPGCSAFDALCVAAYRLRFGAAGTISASGSQPGFLGCLPFLDVSSLNSAAPMVPPFFLPTREEAWLSNVCHPSAAHAI